MHVLGNRIWGFSPELFNAPGATTSETIDIEAQQELVREMAATYPHITQIVMAATDGDPSREGCDEQFEFEFALDLLLDGFQRLHEQGWTSAGRRAPSLRAPVS